MIDNMKIMIVEDDETLAKEIAGYLVKWGYETKTAQNFAKIAEEVTEYAPELVLMDINLPLFDGFYWCRQIRQSSTVPIIYISTAVMTGTKSWRLHRAGTIIWKSRFIWNC